MYIHLQQARLVQRRVKQRQETLVRNVRSGIGDIAPGLGEDTLVVVAIEQSVFGVFGPTWARVGAGGGFGG